MSTAKLGFIDTVVAGACARVYKPFNVGRVVRAVFRSIVIGAVLALAASRLDGWLSVAIWAMVALRFLPYLFVGLAQRIKDEHMARLALLPPTDRGVLTSSTRLARDWLRVA